MKTFEIKISGSGSKKEIADALIDLADSIRNRDSDELDGQTFEDSTLCTEITEQ